MDLAVERHPDRLVLIRHGLGSAGEVDDAQPAMAHDERRGCVELLGTAQAPRRRAHVEETFAVRAPMPKRPGQPETRRTDLVA